MKIKIQYILTLFLFIALSSCNDAEKTTLTCFNVNDQEIMRDPGSACDLSVLFVDLEGAFDLSEYEPDEQISVTLLPSAMVGIAGFFSDSELQEIKDKGLVSKPRPFKKINIFRMPAFSSQGNSGKLVQQEIFEVTEDYIAINDPGNGNKFYIYGFDYIKLRGWPLIPLPKLISE